MINDGFSKFNLIFLIIIWGCVPMMKGDLDCTVNGLTHNYFRITQMVWDTDSYTRMPDPNLSTGFSTSKVKTVATNSPRVKVSTMHYSRDIIIEVMQINEKLEPSRKGPDYYNNFIMNLTCQNNNIVEMYTTFPVIDTNNHKPFFEQQKYIYNLISLDVEDFQRVLRLHPIKATDYDITNDRMEFNISKNSYFDIAYDGIVPNTLNKKHCAKLIPKTPLESLLKPLEVKVKAMDVGFPPQTAEATVVIVPPSPPTPIFDKVFYVGHYYKNDTFQMRDVPHLEEGTTVYETNIFTSPALFEVIVENENISIYLIEEIRDTTFYQQNYISCELKATYTHPITRRTSTGTATLIVEFHHDL